MCTALDWYNITVRVAADLTPLFQAFGLLLNHTVERGGTALIWMRPPLWALAGGVAARVAQTVR